MRKDVQWWLRVMAPLPTISNSISPTWLVNAIYLDLALMAFSAIYKLAR